MSHTYQAPEDRWRAKTNAKPLGLYEPAQRKVDLGPVYLDTLDYTTNNEPVYVYGRFVGVVAGTPEAMLTVEDIYGARHRFKVRGDKARALAEEYRKQPYETARVRLQLVFEDA